MATEQTTESLTGFQYVRGYVHPNVKDTATFEYKRPSPNHTGGGYPRWHSTEYRDHTPGDRRERVFVPVHRLCAVAWCFEDGVTAEDIISDGLLDGVDVHHELGMPSANLESELTLREHGRHSEITQAQVRAWGEDAKRESNQQDSDDSTVLVNETSGCDECGRDSDVLWESDDDSDFSGERCTECVMEAEVSGTLQSA